MKHDFFTAYPAYTEEALEELTAHPPADHGPTLVTLLAQTPACEETKLAGQIAYQSVLQSPSYHQTLGASKRLLDLLQLAAPDELNLTDLPRWSFYLRLDFRLATPYMSRDDRAFAVTENPVRKDLVTGLPFVSSTTWKGAMRHACWLVKGERMRDRLFGPRLTGDSDEEGFRGRLIFYPSFFTEVSFEMINPHDRIRRIGKNPIRMECVPAGADGRFAVLYVPRQMDEESEQAPGERPEAADLEAVTECCRATLSDYGFSAKKSSGYGAAERVLSGRLGLLAVSDPKIKQSKFSSLDELPGVGRSVAQAMRLSQ